MDDEVEISEWWALCSMAAGKMPANVDAPRGELWRCYAPIAEAQSIVLGQLGQSLDGRTATWSGDSCYVNGREGLVHVHRLRALVDAVVVGVGTAVADDPLLTVRYVEGASPARVVVDPHGRLPNTAKVFSPGVRRIALQSEWRPRPPGVETVVLPVRDGVFEPSAIVHALASLGLHRLLIEGGAKTISGFLAAGVLDRLHLCVAPLLIGSGPHGLLLPCVARLDQAIRPPTATYRLGSDVLFDLDLRR
jgi:diaminohydroxyphosphoribosylaminopyrimidine deaminase/5-amino-6-(5-phosphoribosylamino)uracil reductase